MGKWCGGVRVVERGEEVGLLVRSLEWYNNIITPDRVGDTGLRWI